MNHLATLFIRTLCLVLLASFCLSPEALAEPAAGGRYRNSQLDFSLTLPEGWTPFERASATSLVMVGARDAEGDEISVNVTPRGGAISSIDDYLACEQAKGIASSLGGVNIRCSQVKLAGKRAQNIIYSRPVRRGGSESYQFISQIIVNYEGRVYTLTSYAFGPTEAQARDSYMRLSPLFQRVIGSFTLQ